MSTMALAAATGARSCARSLPAPTPPTWGRGRRTPARRSATATGSAAPTSRALQRLGRIRLFARPAQPRRPGAERGLLQHPGRHPRLRRDHRRGGGDVGPRGGEGGAARHAGARQHRRQARDGQGGAEVADGCIVGSSLKVDGNTWNPVDAERAAEFMRLVRETRRLSRPWPRPAEPLPLKDRLRSLLSELMLDPGPQRIRGPCATASGAGA